MTGWRTLILARRQMAFLLVAFVLFAKVFVPTGYMFAPSASGFTVQMCSGQGAMSVVLDIGKTAPTEDHNSSGKTDAPCAFSGLGMAATAAVDMLLLVVAIAFVMARGVASARVFAMRTFQRLRPPLRAPPAYC